MNTHQKNSIFKNRRSNLGLKPRIKMHFTDLLMSATKSVSNLVLNVPETIVKNEYSRSSCLLFTNDDGYLFCKENIRVD